MILSLQTCEFPLLDMTNKRFLVRTKGLCAKGTRITKVEKIKGFRYRESNPGLLGESQLS